MEERITKLAQRSESSLTTEEFQAQVAEADRKARQDLADAKAATQQAAVEKALKRAGVPPRFVGKSFAGYQARTQQQQTALQACRRYGDGWARLREQGVNLVLTGAPGTGKTHLAISVLQQVMQAGHTGVFVSVSEMLRAIRATYSHGAEQTEEQAFRSFIAPDLLVLDEVGVAIGDEEKRKAMVFDVLNARYNGLRPTILIGNLTVPEMQRYLGERVWDRIIEGGAPVVPFDWESYRRMSVVRGAA